MADPFWTHGNLDVFWLMQEGGVDAMDFYARLLQLTLNCFICSPHRRFMPGVQCEKLKITESNLENKFGVSDFSY